MVIYSSIGEAKYLSPTINQDVKWKMYVNNVCMKANKGIGFLPRNVSTSSTFVKEQAHKSLIRHSFEYICSAHQPPESPWWGWQHWNYCILGLWGWIPNTVKIEMKISQDGRRELHLIASQKANNLLKRSGSFHLGLLNNVDIRFSAHDEFLEYTSSGTLKIESQII